MELWQRRIIGACVLLSIGAGTLPVFSATTSAKPAAKPAAKKPAKPATKVAAGDAYHRGLEKARKGDLKGAEAEWTAALKANPRDARSLYHRGLLRHRTGDAAGAAADWNAATKVEASSSLEYQRRGDARREIGDDKGALVDYAEAYHLDPHNLRVLFDRGAIFARQGKMQEAHKEYRLAASGSPVDAAEFEARGLAKFALGDIKGGLADLDVAVSKGKHANAGLLWARAEARMKARDNKGALEDLTDAIKYNPSYLPAYLMRAELEMNMGDSHAAIDDLTKALSINPRLVPALILRAQAKVTAQDYNGAADDAAQATKLDVKSVPGYRMRARIAETRKDFRQALADYQIAAGLDPSNDFWLWKLYENRLNLRDIKGARTELDKVIAAKRATPFSLWVRGSLLRRTNDFNGAIADYDAALKMQPDYVPALTDRGLLQLRRGRFTAGYADLKAASKAQPKAGVSVPNFFYIKRGQARRRLADFSHAREDFEAALKGDPTNLSATVGLAFCQLVQGEQEAARATIAKSKSMVALDEEQYVLRSILEHKFGDVKAAVADTERAIEANPDCADAYHARGRYRIVSGDLKGAAADLETAAHLYSDEDESRSYCAIVAILLNRQLKKDNDSLLKDFREHSRLGSTPLLDYLAGKTSAHALIKGSAHAGFISDARAFIGVNEMADGNSALATKHFEWVRDHGVKGSPAYDLSVAELEVLGKSKPPQQHVVKPLVKGDDAILPELDNEFAMAKGQALIDTDAGDPEGYIDRGAAYAAQGDWNQALADLDKAISLGTVRADAFWLRARVESQLGKTTAAIADYRKVIRLKSLLYRKDAAVRLAAALSKAKMKEEQPEDAAALWEKSINLTGPEKLRLLNRLMELDKTLVAALMARGDEYARTGNIDRAVADYKAALAGLSDEGTWLTPTFNSDKDLGDKCIQNGIWVCGPQGINLRLAQILSANNRAKEALTFANSAISQAPNWADAYKVRGKIYERLSNDAEAQKDFEKAASLKK